MRSSLPFSPFSVFYRLSRTARPRRPRPSNSAGNNTHPLGYYNRYFCRFTLTLTVVNSDAIHATTFCVDSFRYFSELFGHLVPLCTDLTTKHLKYQLKIQPFIIIIPL